MIIGAIIGDITNDSSSIQNLLAVGKAMIKTEPYYDKLKERIGRSIKKQKLFPEQIIILALLSSNIVFRGSVKAVARIIAESFTEDENVIKSAEINADIVHMLANNSSLQDVKEYNHIPLWVIEHGKINKKQYNQATKKEGLSLDLAIVDYNFLPDIG